MIGNQATELVAALKAQLHERGIPESQTAATLSLLSAAAESANGLAAVRTVIEEQLSQAARLTAVLESALAEIRAAEAERTIERRLDPAWRESARERLEAEDDPVEARRLWLECIAEAVAVWDLELAQDVAHEPPRACADETGLQTRVAAGLAALAERRPNDAFELVDQLAGKAVADALRPESRAAIEVLIGRIHLARSQASPVAGDGSEPDPDRARALASFQRARDLAPQRGEPYAALAAYYQAEEQADEAASVAHKAVELSPDLPDGFIALGISAERQDESGEAAGFYDAALERVSTAPEPLLALGRLLGPVPAGVLLRLAQRMAVDGDSEGALTVLDQAFLEGFVANDQEGEAYELKGRTLKALDRPNQEVSDAYYEAGQRYIWAEDPQKAAELLRRATAENPENAAAGWALAEALRILAATKSIDDPQEVAGLIDESLRVWSAVREPPDEWESWTYLNRALINEQLARLGDTYRWALAWEAVAYIESAIVLMRDDPLRWAYLAHFYSSLDRELSALAASATAVEIPPEDDYANEERAIALANAGRFSDLVAHLEKIPAGPWKDSIEAFMLAHSGRPAEGVKKLDRALSGSEQPAMWQLEQRAFCRRRLSESAQTDFLAIWDKREHAERGDQAIVGVAAYELGMLDEAEAIFTRLAAERLGADGAYEYLGLCKLARGDFDGGEGDLKKGVSLATSVRQLDEFEMLEIRDLRDNPPAEVDAVQLHAALDRVVRELEVRREQLRDRSVEDELEEVLAEATPPVDGATPDPVWMGACASLARIHSENERWRDAATRYSQLQAAGFLHAERGLERALGGLEAAAGELVRKGSPAKAVEAYEHVRSLSAGVAERAAAVQAQLAGARFLAGDRDRGRSDLVAAIELFRDQQVEEPGTAVAGAIRPLIPSPSRYWELDRDWAELGADETVPDDVRTALAAAREELATYLNEHFRLGASAHFTFDTPHVALTTPVTVELGEALVPADTQNTPLVTEHAPALRERITADLGVVVPGIRFRAAAAGPSFEYSVLVDEARAATGRIESGFAYTRASVEELARAGVAAADSKAPWGTHTKPPGRWVRPEAVPLLAEAGIEASDDPYVALASHIEEVLRDNMASFVGIQEVDALLAEWSATEGNGPFVESVVPDTSARIRLTAVLRALVCERVPVKRWREILELFDAHAPTGDVADIVRAVRRRLRDELPGSDGTARRVPVPDRCEADLMRDRGESPLGTVSAQAAFDLIAFVRDQVDEREHETVLVVERAELRDVVRRVVSAEFPSLAVLASEELLPDLEAPGRHAPAALATGEPLDG